MVTPVPPFDFIQTDTRNRFMKIMVVLALLMTVLMNFIGGPLTTEAAGAGILSYEFAWDMDTAQAIIDSWDARARLVAAFSLGLDFLYPLVYATAISLACMWAVDRIRPSRPQVADAGIWLAWGAWLAALLDYIENISLVTILFGGTSAVWPLLAFFCAAFKFTLVIAGIFYVLAALFLFRGQEPQAAPKP